MLEQLAFLIGLCFLEGNVFNHLQSSILVNQNHSSRFAIPSSILRGVPTQRLDQSCSDMLVMHAPPRKR